MAPGVPIPTDLKDALFKICPKFSYTAHEAFLAKLAGRKQRREDFDAHETKVKATDDPSLHDILASYYKEEAEQKANMVSLAKASGRTVECGEVLQLMHVHSGLFLTMLKTCASIEDSAMRLELVDHGNEYSQWTLQPGHKTSRRGEKCAFGVPVMFESTKQPGVYIHVSDLSRKETNEHPYVLNELEVNGSSQPTIFKPIPYRASDSSEEHVDRGGDVVKLIYGGDIVKLFNRQTDSFLCYNVGERPAFKCVQNSSEMWAFDSSALWMIEASVPVWAGDVVDEKLPYRLKHLNTNQYLCVLADGVLGGTSEFIDMQDHFGGVNRCLWMMDTKVGKGCLSRDKHLHLGGQAILQSPAGGCFVCVDTHPMAEKPGWHRGLASLTRVEHGAVEFAVKTLYDVEKHIRLMRSSNESLFKLDPLTNIPAEQPSGLSMNELDERCKGPQADTIRLQLDVTTLGEKMKELLPMMKISLEILSMMCTNSEETNPLLREGEPNVQFQEMCLQQNAIDYTIEFLKALFLPASKGGHLDIPAWIFARSLIQKDACYVARLAWRFLKQVVKQNTKNSMTLAKHSRFIASQLTTEFAVVETYTELYNGNLTLIASITDQNIVDVVGIIKGEHDAMRNFGDDFVELLRILCACNNIPIPQNQARVFQHFVKNNFDLLAHVDKRGQTLWLNYQGGRVEVGLESMIGQYKRIILESRATNEAEKLYAYYIRCIQLFAILVTGRNHDVEDFLMDNADSLSLGYQTLLWILTAVRVPWIVKSLCSVLLLALYIDRDPLQPCAPIQYFRCLPRFQSIWVSSEQSAADAFVNYEQHRPEKHFVILKDMVLDYARGLKGKFSMTDREQNALTSSMAVIAHQLFNFGFFHDKRTPRMHDMAGFVGMSTFIEPWMALLDGRNDKDTVDSMRFRNNEQNEPILKTKKLICDILQYVFSCCTEMSVQATFIQYDALVTSLQARPEAYSDPMLCLVTNATIEPFIAALMNVKKLANAYINLNHSSTAEKDQTCDFCFCMLDMCQYDYVPLVVNAFSLLSQYFAREYDVSRAMCQNHIITTEGDARANIRFTDDCHKLTGATRWIASSGKSPEKTIAISESHHILTQLDSLLDAAYERDDGSLAVYQKGLQTLGMVDIIIKILEVPVPKDSGGTFHGYTEEELDRIISEYFDHYDLDQSGTIDAEVELPQLVTNLVIKLKLKVTTKALDAKIKDAFTNQSKAVDVDYFKVWFTNEFMMRGGQNYTHRQLVAMCYQMLASVSKGNPEIQKEVYQHWKLFKSHMQYHDLRSAFVMAAILEDNEELHDSLAEEEIRDIFEALLQTKCADYLVLLQSMVWLKTMGRRHAANADRVSRLFAKYTEVMIFMGPGARPLDVSKVVSGEILLTDVNFHIELMRVFIMTCQGNAPACETRTQTYLVYDSAVSVLLQCIDILEGDDQLGPTNKMKMPTVVKFTLFRVRLIYFHFLNEVYIAGSCVAGSAFNTTKLAGGLWEIPHFMSGTLTHNKTAFRDVHTVLENLLTLQRTTAFAPIPISQQHEFLLLKNFVYGVLLPMLTVYYEVHHRPATDPGGDLTQKFADCIMALRPFATKVQDLLLSRCLLEISEFAVVTFSDVKFISERETSSHGSLYTSLWPVFTVWLGEQIASDRFNASQIHISRGAKVFSEVLATDGMIPDSIELNSKSTQQYRQPVWRMFDILYHSSEEMEPDVILNLLVVCRALIFMDDPILALTKKRIMENPLQHPNRTEELQYLNKCQELNWQRMLDNQPPIKAEPSEALFVWVQNKYTTLGCTKVVSRLVCHADLRISLAAIKFGAVLLEGGNRRVQDSFLNDLKSTTDDSFFARCASTVRNTIQVLKDRELHKIALADVLMVTTGSARMLSDAGESLNALPQQAQLYKNTQAVNATTHTLRFLQLFCEGHHAGFQEYLREQLDNFNSHNLLKEVCALFTELSREISMYIKTADKCVVDLIIQIADFLTEMLQGPCIENGESLSAGDFITYCNRSLECITEQIGEDTMAFRSTLSVEEQIARCEVRTKLVTILMATVEGVRNVKVPRVVISKLDAFVFHRILVVSLSSDVEEYEEYDESPYQKHSSAVGVHDENLMDKENYLRELQRNEAFSVYFLCLSLSEFDQKEGEFPTMIRTCVDKYPKIIRCLSDMSASIEIFRHGACYKTYFRIPQPCLNLRPIEFFKFKAAEAIADIPRENPDEKALQLLRNISKMTGTVAHLNNVLTDERFWWAVEHREFISEAPFRMSGFIVIGLVLMYDTDEAPYFGFLGLQILYDICAWVHIFLNGGQTLVYFMVEAPVTMLFNSPGYGMQGKALGSDDGWDVLAEEDVLPPYKRTLPPWPSDYNFKNIYHRTFFEAKTAPRAWYAGLMFIASVLGATYSIFLHAIILLDFFRTQSGRLVVAACRLGGPKMIKTFMMGFIMILIWTMVSWMYFKTEVHEASHQCGTVYQCTFKAVQSGFRGDIATLHGDVTGSIRGEYPLPLRVIDDLIYQLQVVLVTAFYLLWKFILAGIIQGQIIDAFAEMRLSADQKIIDANERCMVCSLSRFEIDSAGGRFFQHTNNDHLPLAYLFYLVYLDEANQDDDDGMMSYVRQCVYRGVTDFIPVGTCVMMNRDEDDISISNEQLGEEVDSTRSAFEQRVSKIESALDDLDAQMSTLLEAVEALAAE